jgi:PTS system nitrogen regulatory IIA component
METVMSISDHFSAAGVILDADVKDKRALLDFLAMEAAGRLGHSKQAILDALQHREDLGSTALGKGVALPHTELTGVVQPIMLLARLLRPVDFDARDSEPVDLFFLVLWPAAATRGLLDAMSEICRVLRDAHVLRRLRLAETPEEAAHLLLFPGSPGIRPEHHAGR